MIMGSPSQIALAEFRVISDHIGTRDLVQEFLAFKVFPTLREWEMPKLDGEKKKGELVRLPYHYKFKKHFKKPCQEWLDTIEVMCNDILGNYSKKEDQLMTAAFGTRLKRRLNRVLDALNFDYPDYEQLGGDAEGPKRKRIASALDKEGTKLAKKDKEISEKLSPEPKTAAPRKRKAASPKPKTSAREEETPSTPSAAEVEEIMKVMTEPLPIRLSPLAPELTKFFQKDKEASATESPAKPKKRKLSKWPMSFIRHRHRHRRQKLSLPKPQPPEPKPPEPKPPKPKPLEPKPPELKLPEQALKPKPPEPKPGPPKILI
jgi:hypothetical protein